MHSGKESLLVLQVDLFNARGELPVNIAGAQQRQKDILYSSAHAATATC